MADGPKSNPYFPNPQMCCEKCAFGRGEHAEWCEKAGINHEDSTQLTPKA